MARSNGSPRRATLIASALVVGVIVIAGAVLTGRALISDDDSTDTTGPPTSADSSSKCDLPDGDLEKLTEAPEDVEWELVNTYALPTSPAGPAKESSDGVHHCYARSAEGAVLAAASISFDLATPGISYARLAELRMTGPGAAEVAAIDELPQEQRDALAAQSVFQIAAFRVDSITDDTAVVQIVYRYSQPPLAGTLTATTFDLRWVEGDWRVQADELSAPTTSVGNLSEYVEWSGV